MSRVRNVLIVTTDQLSASAVGAYGNQHVRTPNIDALVGRGTALTNCYTPCPLCRPARASWWTGLLPHSTGVRSNGLAHEDQPVGENVPTLGSLFSQAGYRCVHFGKTHDHGTLRGFEHVKAERRDVPRQGPWSTEYNIRADEATARQGEAFLASDSETAEPFVLAVEFNQPHDICEWIGQHAGPHEDEPIPGDLPPLPANFRDEDLSRRPTPVQYICCSHRRLAQTAGWTEENWRYYLAAYYHYVERADAYVGRVMAALEEAGLTDSTLVLFWGDHGEGMAAHRMVTKQVSFYDETTRVPAVVAGKAIGAGEAIDAPTSLLDVLPTLCEFADIPLPLEVHGASLAGGLTGRGPLPVRTHVASEWHTEWGLTYEPGRMIRTPRYKYTCYSDTGGEELFDMIEDPGETCSLIDDPTRADALAEIRAIFQGHLQATVDDFAELSACVPPELRDHPPGAAHHHGPNARSLWDARQG